MNKKTKIIHLIWAKEIWSWGVAYRAIQRELAGHFDFESIEFAEFRKRIGPSGCCYFCQNITQVASVPAQAKHRTISRLGGNMNFEGGTGSEAVDSYMEQMSKCGAVIATNKHLYQIGLMANPNTYLIPNGIDTDVWCPSGRPFNAAAPVVGFIGNVKTLPKVKYKGYDLVTRVCRDMGLELKQALYKQCQIPHDKMKEKFWDQIDIFILPTDGEGCSNSIMEAISCGVPVITTRTAGYHGETLTDGHNVVFVDKDVDSIRRAFRRFIGRPDFFHRLSDNGRKFAIEHHGIDKIAGMYREVFEKHFK